MDLLWPCESDVAVTRGHRRASKLQQLNLMSTDGKV